MSRQRGLPRLASGAHRDMAIATAKRGCDGVDDNGGGGPRGELVPQLVHLPATGSAAGTLAAGNGGGDTPNRRRVAAVKPHHEVLHLVRIAALGDAQARDHVVSPGPLRNASKWWAVARGGGGEWGACGPRALRPAGGFAATAQSPRCRSTAWRRWAPASGSQPGARGGKGEGASVPVGRQGNGKRSGAGRRTHANEELERDLGLPDAGRPTELGNGRRLSARAAAAGARGRRPWAPPPVPRSTPRGGCRRRGGGPRMGIPAEQGRGRTSGRAGTTQSAHAERPLRSAAGAGKSRAPHSAPSPALRHVPHYGRGGEGERA